MSYEFQSRILKDYGHRDHLSLICPPGSGKTYMAIRWLKSKGSRLNWILGPNNAIPVWQEEIWKWLREDSTPIVGIPRTNKISFLKSPPTRWLLITYGTFRSISNYIPFSTLPDAVVLDESDSIKNPRAKVTRAVHAYLREIPYRAILTGTPMETPLDLWAQWYFLDSGTSLGNSFFRYRYKNFRPDHMGWNYDLIPIAKIRINQAIRRTGPIMSEKEMDLPPRTYGKHYVEMSPIQAKFYRQAHDEFMVEYRGREIFSTKWATVRFMKMRQILSGFLKHDTGKTSTIPCYKYNELRDLLLPMIGKHKIVIWCTFRREVSRICEMLNYESIGHVVYQGGMSRSERVEVVAAFQVRRRVRVFVGNARAGGQSITLTAADRVIYFSTPYSQKTRYQSEKRTHRIGSEGFKRIHYIDMIIPESLDEHAVRILKIKKSKTKKLLYKNLIKEMLRKKRS